jgi:hypothetical protein
MITRTNPANPVRNIRVLLPNVTEQDNAAMPFHPALPAFLRGYTVIRFMEWMHTNEAVLPANWSARPKTSDRCAALRGTWAQLHCSEAIDGCLCIS